MKSYIAVPGNSDFSIHNIPFGIAKTEDNDYFVVTRLGDTIINLHALWKLKAFSEFNINSSIFNNRYLNDFIGLGKEVTKPIREKIRKILAENSVWAERINDFTSSPANVTMQMPIQIGDYTDFYSSIEHATNVGMMFRDPDNALLPNWRHIPVGYHGRASSIRLSGTPVIRPNGQQKPDNQEYPVFGPAKLLDFELEIGFVIGKANALGEPIPVNEAEDYIFGLMLFNDWSARDIQKWEYVPLGPFLAKNFISTIAPWIVTLEALEPFRVEGPVQEPEVLPYLRYKGKGNFDVNLFVDLAPEGAEAETICRSNFKYMYWNMAQQLAHHTSGGCNMQIGDVCASGTISGKDETSYGSMLELTWKGSKPLTMKDGTVRKFINDGDTVTLRGYAENDGIRVGFGEASGKVYPAK